MRAALQSGSGPDVRAPGSDLAAHRETTRRASLAEPREDVAEATDVDADGVPCRLYVPRDARDGVVVHLHGGGFVFNDVDVHDALSRRLANRSGRRVLSVDYRRPPEHRFPAAPDDVDTALGWLGRQRPASGTGSPTATPRAPTSPWSPRCATRTVRGAGAGLPVPRPAAATRRTTDGAAGGFDPAEAALVLGAVRRRRPTSTHPDLAPLLSDRLATLPPTLVVDRRARPAARRGRGLARRLAEAGVETVGVRCLGQTHGFYRHAQLRVHRGGRPQPSSTSTSGAARRPERPPA